MPEMYTSEELQAVREASTLPMLQGALNALGSGKIISDYDLEKILNKLQAFNITITSPELNDIFYKLAITLDYSTYMGFNSLYKLCSNVPGFWSSVLESKFDLLASNPNFIDALMERLISAEDWKILGGLEPGVKTRVYGALLLRALECGNLDNLAKLYAHDAKLFILIKDSLDAAKKEDRELLDACIATNFASSLQIKEFSRVGRLTYDQALIACAAIKYFQRDESKAGFNPVVVRDVFDDHARWHPQTSTSRQFGMQDANDLAAILEFMSDNKEYFEGKKVNFIITGHHWAAGEILIKDGQIKIALLDSYGVESTNLKPLQKYAQLYFSKDRGFDNPPTIFYNKERIQWALGGYCHMFALEFVRKLAKVADIFASKVMDHAEDTEHGKAIALPLSMLRSAQVRDLPVLIAQHPENIEGKLINRQGQTADQSVEQHSSYTMRGNKGGTGEVTLRFTNQRLDHKLKRLLMKVVRFMQQMSKEEPAELEKHKGQFSVQGFKAKHDKAMQQAAEASKPKV